MNHHQFPLTLIVLANLPQTWGVGYDSPILDDLVYEARLPTAMIGDHAGGAVNLLPGIVEEAGMQLLGPVSSTDGVDALAGKLLLFRDYEANWDGEQACAPHIDGIYDAIDFLSFLPEGIPTPMPMVLASGDVALYWDAGGLYAEIGFDGSHSYYAYAERPGSAPIHLDDEPIQKGFPTGVLALLGGGGIPEERVAA